MKMADTELKELELELLKKINREVLEEYIDQISAIEKIEWGGGPTGEKNANGDDIYEWPYPKYPVCIFGALKILGTSYSYVFGGENIIKEVNETDPHELDLIQIKQFFTAISRGERFCDGLIASYIKNGYILICLENIRDLMDYYQDELQQL